MPQYYTQEYLSTTAVNIGPSPFAFIQQPDDRDYAHAFQTYYTNSDILSESLLDVIKRLHRRQQFYIENKANLPSW